MNPDVPLEHFELIEDVVAHIRTKLPAESGPGSWKLVCEDVLHCQLPAVEPILLRELEAAKGHPEEEEKIRGLLRAVSWYRHPPKTIPELLAQISRMRSTHPRSEDQTAFDTVESALQNQLEGEQALPAAETIDRLFTQSPRDDERAKLREIRDQVYYQLLYPHWFEVVKRWAATHKT